MWEDSRRLSRRFAAPMLCALLLLVLDGCARRRIATSGAESTPIPVVGTGTISWSLLVLSWHRPDGYQYLAYVDGRRVQLVDVRCERANPTTYSCVAPLPPLRPGRHEIQLATLDTEAGAESSRSPVIVVTVTTEPPTNR
jgi:hypothetical protein